MSFQITDKFRIQLGGNIYINMQELVKYKDQRLFTLKRHEDGYLGIYFELYDQHGTHVASVKRNQLYFTKEADHDLYEEHGSKDRYTLIEKATGRTIVDIRKRAEAKPDELDVSVKLFTPDGFLFDASPTQTNLPGNNVLIGNVFANGGTGIQIS